MILLILFAFIAGFVTILSPCILPVLPIVLSGSLSGGRRRPYGVVTGFIASFTFFTLLLSTLVRSLGIPSTSLRTLAVGIIFIFGLVLIFPQVQTLFEKIASRFANLGSRSNQSDGFIAGLLIGMSLGLVWAPCVGPILASVITLSATSSLTLASVFITLAYATGTAIPLLVITFSGRKIFEKVPWLLSHTTQIQQMFGVIMIFTAMGIYMNLDLRFQVYILDKFPGYGQGLTSIEDNQLVRDQLDKLDENKNTSPLMEIQEESLLFKPGTKAADFTNGGDWINSEPLSLKEELKGKVVLVDFWTYTCINCIRTFPYLTEWYEKYNNQGFEIVGVHSPEFEFEKDYTNVTNAAKEFGLEYPIVQDNDFNIWKAYSNRYWPAHYLIDQNGDIRYTHFGEGKYVETENAIRELLEEAPVKENEEMISRKKLTPETYLGYKRAESYSAQNNIKIDKPIFYELKKTVINDAVGIDGTWIVGPEGAKAVENGAKMQINAIASKIFLVLEPGSEGQGKVTVKLNGQPLPAKYQTADMNKLGEITVDQPRKYDIIDLETNYSRNTLELEFSEGVQAFAFTFGS